MNKFLPVLFVVLLLSVSGFGQKKQTPAKKTDAAAKKTASGLGQKKSPAKKPDAVAKKTVSKPKPVPTPTPADPAAEKTELDEALALPTAAERVKALKRFVAEFPRSEHNLRAAESLVTARAILADEKLQAGENAEGIALFKLAVEEAPTPLPERLFNEIVSKFPANLFYREQRTVAIEIAGAIEKKVSGNVKQLLSLASFYLGIESGSDAKRLAEAAIAADANSVTAYQTLGLAHRLDFDLEESAKAYSKALELDLTSIASKRSLAEMKRALGKPDEAAALYREIVAGNENDQAAKTGLILSLLGAGKRSDAEAEMAKALEQNPKNLNLLSGAAYWYAANNVSDRAVEFGQRAVELEPRYIWGHIALARGLMGQNKPVEAERVLVMARQYGNFPTLEYEIASARLQTGFYREAAEELQKSFTVRDGLVQTRLGRRIAREAGSFSDLIAYERRASIFEPAAADNAEGSIKLKLLLEITDKLSSEAPNETELATLTDEFVKGDDKMKLHRQMYSATLLLQKNVALPKVMELVRSAVGNTDAGLEVSTPAAAVMASELYESRTIAFSRNEMIVVPEVPRQTLSAILRGRIEELTGWTLYQQKSYPEAVVRLRRAISVLPEKSAWWRSSMWRLGSALEADGKDKEALESYVSSYKTDRPNVYKYAVVEAAYKKVHGNTEGLEALIGPNPLTPVVASEPASKPEPKGDRAIPAAAQLPSGVPAEAQARPSDTDIKKETLSKAADKATAVQGDIVSVETKSPEKIPDAELIKRDADSTSVEAKLEVKSTDPKDPQLEESKGAEKNKDATAKPVETTPAAETNVPKKEDVPLPEKLAELRPVSSEAAEKTSTEPVKSNEPGKKDESAAAATLASQLPLKTAAEGKPKPEDTKVSDVAGEIKGAVPEIKKTDTPVEVLPVVETDKNPKPEPLREESADVPTKDKEIKTSDAASEPVKSKTDDPVKTENPPAEPKNLLRDPFVVPEMEQKNEPKDTAAKPETLEKPTEIPSDGSKNKPSGNAGQIKPPVVTVSDPLGKEKAAPAVRELFEPVIITVPSAKPPVAGTTGTLKRSENIADASKSRLVSNTENVAKPSTGEASSGATRVRVVDGKEIKADSQCTLELSHETVSLLNGGGSLGVLATVAEEGGFGDLTVGSSSPNDVAVRAEPEIEGVTGRRFYVIKSVSTKTGLFQVVFESKCGRKEIVVRVR